MTGNIIGIRREDKNIWERRAPLTPFQVGELIKREGLRFQVQHSEIRAFSDDEYQRAGAEVRKDISDCPVVLGIKEMPLDFFRPERSYLFFAHVIKGQAKNMPMLKRMMELGCSLIDYEKITDDEGRRLIFFGRFAGIAGMIDTLSGLGKRLEVFGLKTPFLEVKLAHEYERVEVAKNAIAQIGERIRKEGLPDRLVPFIIGVTGYGNVAKGAGEVLSALGTTLITPDDLPEVIKGGDAKTIYQVVFKERDTVEPKEPGHSFDLNEYYARPDLYRSRFERYLPYLSVLVNCIYWDSRYPRLVTKEYLRQAFRAGDLRLIIIGDISCDIEGSIEATIRATNPGEPFFVYDPVSDKALDGIKGEGIPIMAVDNLPCELAVDSSAEFGQALMPFVPVLAQTDFKKDFDALDLPLPLKRALIVHKGVLTKDYQYLERFLERSDR
ncbi:MAG: bifunctional lysine ketoglutarate reductase /saccharopine dehydrogenase family protein [candidate division WOR-3 bacterium]